MGKAEGEIGGPRGSVSGAERGVKTYQRCASRMIQPVAQLVSPRVTAEDAQYCAQVTHSTGFASHTRSTNVPTVFARYAVRIPQPLAIFHAPPPPGFRIRIPQPPPPSLTIHATAAVVPQHGVGEGPHVALLVGLAAEEALHHHQAHQEPPVRRLLGRPQAPGTTTISPDGLTRQPFTSSSSPKPHTEHRRHSGGILPHRLPREERIVTFGIRTGGIPIGLGARRRPRGSTTDAADPRPRVSGTGVRGRP